jgi:hypothetical protein
VFPENIAKQPAPENVVAEGGYWYNIRATDSQYFADEYGSYGTLAQSYDVLNIPVSVRYNMADVEK